MRIRITSAAEQDIEAGYHFYERKTPDLGIYFLDTIYSDIDSLSVYAGIHRVVFELHRLLSRRFPFAIYYELDEDVVIVKAVLDCRKNPTWIKNKLMSV